MNFPNFNDNTMGYGPGTNQLAMAGNMVLQNSRTNINSINDDLRKSIIGFQQKIDQEKELKAQLAEQEAHNYEIKKMEEFKNMPFYSADDNDANRLANKHHNTKTNLIFAITATTDKDTENEQLRKYQQALAHSTALTQQVYAKNMIKLKESEEERKRQELEEMALRRIELRKQRYPGADKQVQSIVKHEMNNLNNNITQNINSQTGSQQLVNQKNIQLVDTMGSTCNGISEMNTTITNQQPIQLHTLTMPHQIIQQTLTQTIPNHQMTMPAETIRRDFSEQYNFTPMQSTMPHMDHFKRKEVFDDKFYIDDLVKEIRERLNTEINFKMQQFHEEMLGATSMIKKQVLNLSDMALKVNQEKNHIDHEINGLRKQILNKNYEDELRTTEIMKALTSEDNYKILPSDTFYRDSGGRIKDIKKIDDDYIEYMDYLANGTGNKHLREQRTFIPLADYDDVYKDEYYGKKDQEYESLMNYNNRLSNYYNF